MLPTTLLTALFAASAAIATSATAQKRATPSVDKGTYFLMSGPVVHLHDEHVIDDIIGQLWYKDTKFTHGEVLGGKRDSLDELEKKCNGKAFYKFHGIGTITVENVEVYNGGDLEAAWQELHDSFFDLVKGAAEGQLTPSKFRYVRHADDGSTVDFSILIDGKETEGTIPEVCDKIAAIKAAQDKGDSSYTQASWVEGCDQFTVPNWPAALAPYVKA